MIEASPKSAMMLDLSHHFLAPALTELHCHLGRRFHTCSRKICAGIGVRTCTQPLAHLERPFFHLLFQFCMRVSSLTKLFEATALDLTLKNKNLHTVFSGRPYLALEEVSHPHGRTRDVLKPILPGHAQLHFCRVTLFQNFSQIRWFDPG